MTVQIVLDRNSVWRDIDTSAYDVPTSEEQLMSQVSIALCRIGKAGIGNSINIGDAFVLIAKNETPISIQQALATVDQVAFDRKWLVEKAPAKMTELESLAEYTGYPYEQIAFRYSRWHDDNPTAYITWFIREEKQRFVFNRICRAFNEIERDYGGVIDCGELGYCRMFWQHDKWQCEWLDEIESLDDIDGDVEYKRDYVNTWH